jgi:hypothetical protein
MTIQLQLFKFSMNYYILPFSILDVHQTFIYATHQIVSGILIAVM